MQVAIENNQDEERQGEGWTARLGAPYGYIRGTVGHDKECVDVFLGDANGIWLIKQNHLDTGEFDEHKVMLGFDNLADALTAYTGSYPDGRGLDRIGAITSLMPEEFQVWINKYGTAPGAEGQNLV